MSKTKSNKITAVVVKYDRPADNELVRVAHIQKESQQKEVQTINIHGVFYPPFAFQDLAGLYGKNQYHDGCINIKAACTAGLGWTIVAVDPKDEKKKEKHEEYNKLKKFLDDHPRYALQPFSETLYALQVDSEISGDMFFEVVRDNKGDISEIYHMPFKEMLIKYDEKTRKQTVIQWIPPSEIEFQPFGAKVRKKDGLGYVSEYIHIKTYNPNNRFYGMPEYLGALRDMAADMSAAVFQNAKFKNNMRPDAIVEVMADHDPNTIALIQEFFKNNYRGEENAGKGLVVMTGDDGEAKPKINVKTLDADSKEASYRQSRIDFRDAIIAAHRVPKTLLSIAQAGKLGNTESGDLKIFKELIIEPRQNRMEFMLNEFIVKQGLGITKFKIKLNELNIENIKDDANFLQAMALTGAWTKNEVREYTGKDPIEGLDSESVLSGSPTPGDPATSVATTAAAMNLNGIQIQAATKIVGAVSAGEIPRDSAKNQLKIFFGLNDEQAEALLGDAGTGSVIQPDKKKDSGNNTTAGEGAELVKALMVMKAHFEKTLN